MSDAHVKFFERVLEIICYHGDRSAHTKRFLDLCEDKAKANPISITPEGYLQALAESTREVFEKYLKTAIPYLTPKQKNELLEHLQTIASKHD